MIEKENDSTEIDNEEELVDEALVDDEIVDADLAEVETHFDDDEEEATEDGEPKGPKYREHVLYAPPGKSKERVDIFLTRHLANATRSKIQKLIEAHYVTINGEVVKKPGRIVVPNDRIVAIIPRAPAPQIRPENIPLDIVYEDASVLIVNKPAGMVVHPAFGNYHGTLVNALLAHAERLSQVRGQSSPGILHRIDKGTSGLLVVAKTNEAHHFIASQFRKHTIEREYWAITWGRFDSRTGFVELPIGRNKIDRKKMDIVATGKYAYTSYESLTDYGFMSLVKLRLKTGRTHQIRVHLSHLHHPILGDPTYGGRRIMYGSITPQYKSFIGNLLNNLNHQALHAKTLGFVHPASHEFVAFEAPLPSDMQAILTKLKNYTRFGTDELEE